MKKLICVALVLAMVCCLLAGCGSTTTTTTTTTATTAATAAPAEAEAPQAPVAEKDTLNVSISATSFWFNPNIYGGGHFAINFALCDYLFRYDANGKAYGYLVSDYSQDGSTITLKLREDVTFADGTPLTAEDVVFSYEVNLTDPTYGYVANMYFTAVEAIDDYTVQLSLVNSHVKWKDYLCTYIGIVEKAAYDENADYTTTAPAGSGAYTLASVADGKVTLVARENPWNAVPAYKTVIVNGIASGSTVVMALQTGEIDVATTIDATGYEQLQNVDDVTATVCSSSSTLGVCDFITDVELARAIYYCIDTQLIVDIVTNGSAVPSSDMFSAIIMGDLAGKANFTGYNPELAKECLAKSSYNGETIVIEAYDSTSAACAAVMQSCMAQIGITAEIVEEDSDTFFDNMLGGNMQLGLCAMGSSITALETMFILFDPTYAYPFQVSDALVEVTQSAPTIADDDAYFANLLNGLNLMDEEGPWVPLYDTPMYLAYRNEVANVPASAAETGAFYFDLMAPAK